MTKAPMSKINDFALKLPKLHTKNSNTRQKPRAHRIIIL